MIVICVIVKFVTCYLGAENVFNHEQRNSKVFNGFYTATLIQQILQLTAFITALIILYLIRTILRKRPVCQTELCEP